MFLILLNVCYFKYNKVLYRFDCSVFFYINFKRLLYILFILGVYLFNGYNLLNYFIFKYLVYLN